MWACRTLILHSEWLRCRRRGRKESRVITKRSQFRDRHSDGLPRKHCFLQVIRFWLLFFSFFSICCITAFQREAKHYPFWVLRSVWKKQWSVLELTATNMILAISQKWCNCVSTLVAASLPSSCCWSRSTAARHVFAQVQGGLTGSQLEGAAETNFLSHWRVLRSCLGFIICCLFIVLYFIDFETAFLVVWITHVETGGKEKI